MTISQAQLYDSPEMNASIVYLDQEAHIVFSGPIIGRLNDAELLAVIAHELSHVRLFRAFDGELEVADRIITAIANNYQSEPPWFETARLFKLYTEIYCDRGAYTVVGDTGPVITSLLKIATGLGEVSAESYAEQAEAVFAAEPGTRSVTPSHPTNFIRTRALRLWADRPDEAGGLVAQMIGGSPELDRLDLFAQKDLNDLTRAFLVEYLRPEWFRSALVEGLAEQYFPKISFTAQDQDPSAPAALAERLAGAHPSIQDYFAYVLLDFVLTDPSLGEMPAGRAFEFAGETQLTAAFDSAYKKSCSSAIRNGCSTNKKFRKPMRIPLSDFLTTAFDKGDYSTDDSIAFVIPLFQGSPQLPRSGAGRTIRKRGRPVYHRRGAGYRRDPGPRAGAGTLPGGGPLSRTAHQKF
ncbi:M48 family metalloprotease [Puia sp. P3]|uniref:M48 family metalloprotease n=1 Tax=Puia sp. P3 TaxID=3423952 RepID=UPI003D6791C4